MIQKQVSVLGNMRIAGALILDQDNTDFPSSAKLGTLLIKGSSLYAYLTIGNMNTWYPIFQGTSNSYVHTQGIPSLRWIVNHGLNTTHFWYQIKDSNNNVVGEQNIEIIDNNSFALNFDESFTGTCIVVGANSVDLTNVSASLISVGTGVSIDTSGVYINGSAVLTAANLTSVVDAQIAALSGSANGLATLGADGKVPSAQLPPIASDWNSLSNKPTALSAFTNDQGFITSAGAPVQSVNGKTGTVVLTAADISGIATKTSQLTNDAGFITAADVPSAPVTSVAGRTGAVTLAYTDVSGLSTVAHSGSYTDLTNKPSIPSAVSQLTNDSNFIAASGAPVQSVAGKTGAVTLTVSDVTGALAASVVGQANGVVPLGSDSRIAAVYLPSYMDIIEEFANLAAFPATGAGQTIYLAKDTDKVYRWSGSVYVEISPSPGSSDAVAEGTVNLYFTNARAAAAAPVQSVAGRTGAVVLAASDISGLSTVATSGSYTDLTNKPSIPTAVSQLTNDSGFITSAQVNYPVTSVAGRTGAVVLTASDVGGLAPVATAGTYASLTGKPTIPTAVSQLTNDAGYITSAPVTSVAGRTGAVTLAYTDVSGLSTVAHTGAYADLTGKPTVPTAVSQLTNDTGFITASGAPVTSVAGRTGAVVLSYSDVSGLAAVAHSGSYADLTGTPTVPTKTSQLTNDSSFITSAGAPVQSVAGRSGTVVLSQADISGLTATSSPTFAGVTATTFTGALSGNATTSTTANNLAAGAAGSLPYQTAAGTTGFLAAGTNGYVLTLAGGVPTWAAASGGGGVTGSDDTSTASTMYPLFSAAAGSGATISAVKTSSSKFTFNPSTGTLFATNVGTSSDLTLKKNVENITDPFAILSQLQGISYDWIDGGEHSYGFGAQDLEKVLPELVQTNAEGQKSVLYTPIIAFLVEAVKQLKAQLDAATSTSK